MRVNVVKFHLAVSSFAACNITSVIHLVLVLNLSNEMFFPSIIFIMPQFCLYTKLSIAVDIYDWFSYQNITYTIPYVDSFMAFDWMNGTHAYWGTHLVV